MMERFLEDASSHSGWHDRGAKLGEAGGGGSGSGWVVGQQQVAAPGRKSSQQLGVGSVLPTREELDAHYRARLAEQRAVVQSLAESVGTLKADRDAKRRQAAVGHLRRGRADAAVKPEQPRQQSQLQRQRRHYPPAPGSVASTTESVAESYARRRGLETRKPWGVSRSLTRDREDAARPIGRPEQLLALAPSATAQARIIEETELALQRRRVMAERRAAIEARRRKLHAQAVSFLCYQNDLLQSTCSDCRRGAEYTDFADALRWRRRRGSSRLCADGSCGEQWVRRCRRGSLQASRHASSSVCAVSGSSCAGSRSATSHACSSFSFCVAEE